MFLASDSILLEKHLDVRVSRDLPPNIVPVVMLVLAAASSIATKPVVWGMISK